MFERGAISFVFLWILNPIVILFYQNCSWTVDPRAAATPAAAIEQRLESVILGAVERMPSCVASKLASGPCSE